MKLKFSRGNAKLDSLEKVIGGQVWTFSVRSGYTCPYAKDCFGKAVNGKVVDGQHTKFRCFSASQEALYPNTYKARLHNEKLIKLAEKDVDKAAQAIIDNLPKKAAAIRIHVGGDFKNQPYFDAWLTAAERTPDIIFYTYTKSLPFWLKRRKRVKAAENFILTASEGGWKDKLIKAHRLRFARVVFSTKEAKRMKLEIDKDDSHATKKGRSFALLLHGTQPKGSDASKAWQEIKQNEGGYSRK